MNDSPYRTCDATAEPEEAIPNFRASNVQPSRFPRYVARTVCLLIPVAAVVFHWTSRGGYARSSSYWFEGYLLTCLPIFFAIALVGTLATVRLQAILHRRHVRAEVRRRMMTGDVRDPRATVRRY